MAEVRKVADTVLYEGYLLYPYRASSGKNLTRVRWQFGVLVPRAHAEAEPAPAGGPTVSGAAESWYSATECILDPSVGTHLDVTLRFLRLQSRHADPETDPTGSGDEGAETELGCGFSLEELLAGDQIAPFELAATSETDGGVTRRCQALSLRLRASAELLPGPYGIARLRVVVENVTGWSKPGARREEVLAHSTVAPTCCCP